MLRERGTDAVALPEWHGGRYLAQPDDVLLRVALTEGRTLVTYDVRTIPPLLRSLTEAGGEHAGVIFVSRKTIAPDDVGGLVEAIERLLRVIGDGLRNQTLFLSRSR